MSIESSAKGSAYFETTGLESPCGSSTLADDFQEVPATPDRLVFAGRKWSVVEQEVTLPGTTTAQKAVFERHPGAVCVLAFNDLGEILLVNQYRHPAGSVCWEVPAGLLDIAGEPPLIAAQREFAEEALAQAERWGMLTEWVASPTIVGEPLRVFVAAGVRSADRPEGFEVEGEEQEMTRAWVPFADVLDAVVHSQVANPGLMIAVLTAARRARHADGALDNPDLAWPTHPAYRDLPGVTERSAESGGAGAVVPAAVVPTIAIPAVDDVVLRDRSAAGSSLADVYQPAEVVSEDLVCSPGDFKVRRDTFKMAKAGEVTREVVCAGDRLAVLAEDSGERVFLQRRYIPATDHFMWQLPSIRFTSATPVIPTSTSLDDQRLTDVQKVLSQLDIQSSSVTFVGRWFETPGGFDQHTRCVHVKVDQMPPSLSGQWFPRDEVMAAIDDGKVHDFSVVVGNLLAEYYIR